MPGGSASAPPASGQPENVEIRIRETNELLMDIPFLASLDGSEYSPFAILGFLTAITVFPILLVGGLIAGTLRVGDRQTNSVKENAAVKQAQVALSQREAERLKALRQAKTPKPKPESHYMPRWSLISNTLIAVTFAFFTGALIGNYLPEGGSFTPAMLNWTLVFLALAFMGWLSWSKLAERLYLPDDKEAAPIPWAWLWVIITGLLIVVLGLGFSIAMLPG